MQGRLPPCPAAVILPEPPGTGKGPQARRPEKDSGLIRLSTGDLLWSAVAAETPAGRAAKTVMEAGTLASDDIVPAKLADRIAWPDIRTGIRPDGFPRTNGQAAVPDAAPSGIGQTVTAAISPGGEGAAMAGRVPGRHSCAACGEGGHDKVMRPAAAGVCDTCGGTAFRRPADDTVETVRAGLQACHAQTAPLIAYYDRRGVLERIDAMGPIAEIRKALATIVARIAA
jgi:adenylate kinase